jgi:pyruvate dehydrogenase E2 component (dihydrolipoamide acetyltransferase)
MAEIRMPKMGDGMEEGTINAWLKREGDTVAVGEPIAEVETDKANVEISAYESGVLTRIIVQVGETVPVGAVIAQVGGQGIAVEPSRSVEPKAATRSGNGSTASESNGAAAAPTPVAAPGTERVKASPLARRMMTDLAVDAALVVGTGPGGRIVERDVTAFIASRGERPRALPLVEAPVTSEATPVASHPPAVSVPISAEAGTETKPSNMRNAIARRTVLSKQTIPHFYMVMVIEMDRALALLKELNADATDGKVTVNDVIVKACAVALGKVPQANSTWTADNTIRMHRSAHIGIAVSIDEGLIIPVIRDCDSKTLRQISADAKQLVVKARANQLKPEEYSGGTFSTSNVGMMGVDEFTAIINPPEAAILAIGGIFREPVVVGDTDQIVIRSRMKVTISADHRLLDGASAARFLQEVKKALEAPFSLLS